MAGLCCIGAGACGLAETQDAANPITPAEAAGSGGGLGPQAGAGSQAVATAGIGGSAGAQGAPQAGSSAGAAGAGAGGQAGALDAGPGPDGSVDAGEAQDPDSAVSAGPTDYGARGPYEVVIEKNVGSAFRNNVPDDTLRCQTFIGLVGGSNPDVAAELTSYPADMERGLYTLFRPAQLEEGRKYPVLTWGNGTCSHPLLFSELLEHLASHGFLVIATNSRWVAGGVEMLRGIDFMLSEDENANSPLYGKIDTQMLGACGHSQGSGATVTVGADPRIVATVPIQGASAAAVADLEGATFLIAGELDTLVAPSTVETAFDAATVPAVYGLSMGQDHLMPGLDPSPILDAVTAWFKIHLTNDSEARELFYGDACKLCSDPRWMLMRKNL